MSEPLLFTRNGSDNQVERPVIGNGGAWTTTPKIYNAGKFGSGTYSTSGAVYVSYPGFTNFTIDKCTFEFWWKPDFGVTNGIPDDATVHYQASINGDTTNYISWGLQTVTSLRCWIRVRAAGVITDFAVDTFNCSANSLNHIAIVRDNDGIDGTSERIRMYHQGSLIKSTTTGTTGTNASTFSVNVNSMPPLSVTTPSSAVFDNVKIYDYAKTDFSDRFNERGGLNDQQIIL